jgi:hypothetical protein
MLRFVLKVQLSAVGRFSLAITQVRAQGKARASMRDYRVRNKLEIGVLAEA